MTWEEDQEVFTSGRYNRGSGCASPLRFAAADADSVRFFRPGAGARAHFDLPGYIGARLARAGVGAFENLGLDTYADETRFYSFRRATHRKEPDFGRLVAAIALS